MLVMTLAISVSASEWTYGGNCALYAREVSGIELQGNAGSWWDAAAGRYARGHQPQAGAVLVFRRSGSMPSGHVAVVARVLSRREIQVDQANWVRGRVTKNISVIDVSDNNDWTIVQVEELRSHTHGRDNPAYGFVYPDRGGHDLDRVTVARNAVSPTPAAAGLIHLAVAAVIPSAEAAPLSRDRAPVRQQTTEAVFTNRQAAAKSVAGENLVPTRNALHGKSPAPAKPAAAAKAAVQGKKTAERTKIAHANGPSRTAGKPQADAKVHPPVGVADRKAAAAHDGKPVVIRTAAARAVVLKPAGHAQAKTD